MSKIDERRRRYRSDGDALDEPTRTFAENELDGKDKRTRWKRSGHRGPPGFFDPKDPRCPSRGRSIESRRIEGIVPKKDPSTVNARRSNRSRYSLRMKSGFER